MTHREWPIQPTRTRPMEPAMPPSAPSGAAGLNATQVARLNLEAQQRTAKALEDIRDIVRTAAESLAPVLVQLGQSVGPMLAKASADMRKLADAMLASLEYSPLDTHED